MKKYSRISVIIMGIIACAFTCCEGEKLSAQIREIQKPTKEVEQTGTPESKIEYYTRAIESNPKDALAYCNRGVVYGGSGEYQKAIDDFTKAIELDPKFALAYYNRGLAYGGSGEHKKAIDDFTRAIKLNPKDALAYYNRGLSCSILNLTTAACDDFYQAGLLYLGQNQRDKALECVDSMKKADPYSPLIKKLLDEIYVEKPKGKK